MVEIFVQAWPVPNAGSLIGSANAVIAIDWGDIKIKQIRVVKGKDGKPRVFVPQREFEKDGVTQYVDILELPYRIMSGIKAQVLEQLEL